MSEEQGSTGDQLDQIGIDPDQIIRRLIAYDHAAADGQARVDMARDLYVLLTIGEGAMPLSTELVLDGGDPGALLDRLAPFLDEMIETNIVMALLRYSGHLASTEFERPMRAARVDGVIAAYGRGPRGEADEDERDRLAMRADREVSATGHQADQALAAVQVVAQLYPTLVAMRAERRGSGCRIPASVAHRA